MDSCGFRILHWIRFWFQLKESLTFLLDFTFSSQMLDHQLPITLGLSYRKPLMFYLESNSCFLLHSYRSIHCLLCQLRSPNGGILWAGSLLRKIMPYCQFSILAMRVSISYWNFCHLSRKLASKLSYLSSYLVTPIPAKLSNQLCCYTLRFLATQTNYIFISNFTDILLASVWVKCLYQ